ncbi:S8 family serine peptidase [Phenylobacterium sp.]|uniref:S8 family serine peptidase n=1 Tax=Phenylobacterium sp. TaxID=1871053 RepID=UPI002FCC61F2
MAKNPTNGGANGANGSGIDNMLMAALQHSGEELQTGRYVITYKEGALESGTSSLQAEGLRTADARDFADQDISLAELGDADAFVLPEIGVAVVSAAALQKSRVSAVEALAQDSPIEAVEPEYFAFADNVATEYLRGFRRAVDIIVMDFEQLGDLEPDDSDVEAEVLGATWGLARCKVPPSSRSGAGIRLAVLDTGMDLGHPDFTGRQFFTQTFVGQPVQDLHSHGTHCIGTAAGPLAPPGVTPRYGIAYKAPIYPGKVLTNSGSGTTASVLAGMNWAIANRCAVISMSLGSSSPVQAAYTAAGRAALVRGCLIVAAAGNSGGPTGSPANSPTIMAVASLDSNLAPSSFSSFGKIEIAAPGRDVLSSVPRPTRYGVKSGTSMATPHVAGCAALWAQTNPNLRGQALWNKLIATARPLPYPRTRVGAGLVQAPA